MLARERGELLVEGERRRRPGRVVRVVDPDEGRSPPCLGGNAVEVGEKAVLLEQRQLLDPRTGELGTSHGHGIPGLGRHHRVTSAGEIEDDLREREDRLLRAERRDHVGARVERDPEPSPDPAGDRLAELGQPDGRRIAHPLAHAFTQRLDDARIGGLARVAHPEVDHLEPFAPGAQPQRG